MLVRSLNPYHGLIDAAFEEHGIPWFVDRRRTATHHPLLQFLRALFHVIRFEWPHDAAMTLLKSGLAGVSDTEADELENYVLEHRLYGSVWESAAPWAFHRELTRHTDDAERPPPQVRSVDLLRRRLVDRMMPLAQMLRRPGEAGATVREIATELFATFDRFEVPRTLAGWMDAAVAGQRFEQRAEHERAWGELVGLFEQMVDLLGEERVTPADFVNIMESGLEQFDLALTPATVDQVLVGQIDRTRTPQVKAVLLLGLNEGEFPASANEASVFSDRERRNLRERRRRSRPRRTAPAARRTIPGLRRFYSGDTPNLGVATPVRRGRPRRSALPLLAEAARAVPGPDPASGAAIGPHAMRSILRRRGNSSPL